MDTRDPIKEQQAFIEGERAGHLSLAPGLNPYPMGTAEACEWERARRNVVARKLAAELRERARRVTACHYRRENTCDCGGRGLCLDVA